MLLKKFYVDNEGVYRLQFATIHAILKIQHRILDFVNYESLIIVWNAYQIFSFNWQATFWTSKVLVD